MGKRLKIPKKMLMSTRKYKNSPSPAWMASLAVCTTPTVDSGLLTAGLGLLGGLGTGHLLEPLGDPVGENSVKRWPIPVTDAQAKLPNPTPAELRAWAKPVVSTGEPRLTPMTP